MERWRPRELPEYVKDMCEDTQASIRTTIKKLELDHIMELYETETGDVIMQVCWEKYWEEYHE